ncbi:MAG TPA: hypothetical protein VFG07_06575 [Thermoplasmata archaeon]|nr:hypothetical protein [Thermoplasmata archaeon]
MASRPQFNFTTGVGMLMDSASARSCPATVGYGSYLLAANTELVFPLHLHAGHRVISPTVRIALTASSLLSISGPCPVVLNSTGFGTADCRGMARYDVWIYPLVFDLTNKSYLGGFHVLAGLKFTNATSAQNYTSCQNFNCSGLNIFNGNRSDRTHVAGGATWHLNGTVNGTHRYVLILWITVSVGVFCFEYSHCFARARVDMASGGRDFRLVAVKIV